VQRASEADHRLTVASFPSSSCSRVRRNAASAPANVSKTRGSSLDQTHLSTSNKKDAGGLAMAYPSSRLSMRRPCSGEIGIPVRVACSASASPQDVSRDVDLCVCCLAVRFACRDPGRGSRSYAPAATGGGRFSRRRAVQVPSSARTDLFFWKIFLPPSRQRLTSSLRTA
jgi:hypothetical protein